MDGLPELRLPYDCLLYVHKCCLNSTSSVECRLIKWENARKYIHQKYNKMLPFKELICCWFCMVGFRCKSVSNSIWHIIHSIQLPHSHKCAAHSTRLRSYPRVSLCVVFTPMEISFIRNSNSYSIFCLLCINRLMPLKIIQAFFNTSQKQKVTCVKYIVKEIWVHCAHKVT